MIIEIVQAIGWGLIGGVLTGIMPGIGIMLGFLLFLPLIAIDPLCVLLYALVLKVGSQFFGSMAVLYLKIPGESSSFPVLLELKNLKSEDIYKAVMLTNFGSLVASIFSTLVLFWFIQSPWAKNIYFPIELKSAVFLLLILIALFSNKNPLANFWILLFGSFINFYAGPTLDFDIQVILNRQEVPACVLGGESEDRCHLGWSTWLSPTKEGPDLDHSVFRMSDAPAKNTH